MVVVGEADGAVDGLELVLAARVERRAAARIEANVPKLVVADRDAAQGAVPLLLDRRVARVRERAVSYRDARAGAALRGAAWRQADPDEGRGQAGQACRVPERQAPHRHVVRLDLYARGARKGRPRAGGSRAGSRRDGEALVDDEDCVVVRHCVRHDDDSSGVGRVDRPLQIRGRLRVDDVDVRHVLRCCVRLAPSGVDRHWRAAERCGAEQLAGRRVVRQHARVGNVLHDGVEYAGLCIEGDVGRSGAAEPAAGGHGQRPLERRRVGGYADRLTVRIHGACIEPVH